MTVAGSGGTGFVGGWGISSVGCCTSEAVVGEVVGSEGVGMEAARLRIFAIWTYALTIGWPKDNDGTVLPVFWSMCSMSSAVCCKYVVRVAVGNGIW